MTLHLFEILPAERGPEAVRATVGEAAREHGGAVLESQTARDDGRVFAVVELDGPAEALGRGLRERLGAAAAEFDGPHEVRLVGAEPEQIRALTRSADYLVEWDIPAEIGMERYLEAKRAKSPRYAEIPEVSFLRTYVREDTVKCLCLYDAPDGAAVRRAREIVSTPVDRLHRLEEEERPS